VIKTRGMLIVAAPAVKAPLALKSRIATAVLRFAAFAK
jgi:hypothetical protein